jgi:N utilization substance protein A
MVVSELRGEKIDIIPWNPEPARFVAKALSPARVREVYLDDDAKEATVIVPDDQLALAIGKEGMNARLAARLTGWKVDIQSEREFAQAEAAAAFGGSGGQEDEFSGRCAAILANGKRCPNAALPGTRFCGVPAHQELAKVEAATGTYAEGSVQPTPQGEVEEPAEGEEAAPEEQVSEASPPGEPVTEPEPTPEAREPKPETGPPVEPTAEGDGVAEAREQEEETQPAA